MTDRIFFALCMLTAGYSLAAAPELVTVGDAGNPGKKVFFHEVPNPYPRGGVGYPYRIGKNEICYCQTMEDEEVISSPNSPYLKITDDRSKTKQYVYFGHYDDPNLILLTLRAPPAIHLT